jgi:hypothetical protein
MCVSTFVCVCACVCVMEKIATKCLYLKRETGSAYTCVQRKRERSVSVCVCVSVLRKTKFKRRNKDR